MNVTLYFSFFVLHCIVSNICKCSKNKAYIVNKNNRVKKNKTKTTKQTKNNTICGTPNLVLLNLMKILDRKIGSCNQWKEIKTQKETQDVIKRGQEY